MASYLVSIKATMTFELRYGEDGELHVVGGWFDDREDAFPDITRTIVIDGKQIERDVEWSTAEYDKVMEALPGKGEVALP